MYLGLDINCARVAFTIQSRVLAALVAKRDDRELLGAGVVGVADAPVHVRFPRVVLHRKAAVRERKHRGVSASLERHESE